MKYDVNKLAAYVVAKRQIQNRLSMRQAAKEIGIWHKDVHKAETRKPLSEKSFIKICAWLEVSPGAYFKQEAE